MHKREFLGHSRCLLTVAANGGAVGCLPSSIFTPCPRSDLPTEVVIGKLEKVVTLLCSLTDIRVSLKKHVRSTHCIDHVRSLLASVRGSVAMNFATRKCPKQRGVRFPNALSAGRADA